MTTKISRNSAPCIKKVEGFISSSNKELSWNVNIDTIWEEGIKKKIIEIPLGGVDIRCWGTEPPGHCSTKALCKSLKVNEMGPHLPRKKVWKMKIPSMFKLFLGEQNHLDIVLQRPYVSP
eukprot:TRINITY_DN24663_c0_g3_i1.p2 TRINITY_DN24663_c0_g3~~TRINITY_DN24663_c0_g3_i1.p2  ORF type:complete len:120 (+),score=13.12 TRINITY_DN24663_c0_g3_i1:101-460(+)